MEAIFSASMNSSQTLPTTTTSLGRNPSGAGSQENVILGDCIAGLLRKVSHGEHQRVVHRVARIIGMLLPLKLRELMRNPDDAGGLLVCFGGN